MASENEPAEISPYKRMMLAVRSVKKGGKSLRDAAEFYGLKKSTLADHVSGKRRLSVGKGGPTLLSKEEEEALSKHLSCLAEMGFGLDDVLIAQVVKTYLDMNQKVTQLKGNLPKRRWLRGFLLRNNELSLRKAEQLAINRARGLTTAVVRRWYNKLENKLKELDILNSPQNIHNCDETGLVLDRGGKKIVCRRGTRNPLLLTGVNNREMVTTLFAVNAAGQSAPPFVLYKAKSKTRIPESWTVGGPNGAAYGTSESGWMTEGNFFLWLQQLFIPWTESIGSDKPHILILDGHASHISMRVKQLADQHNVHLFLLLPHSSHFLQPLDVACFGPLKKVWRKVLNEFAKSSMFEKVKKIDFPDLLKTAIAKGALCSANAVAGFKATGICPFDNEKAKKTGKLRAGDVLTSDEEEEDMMDEDNCPVQLSPQLSPLRQVQVYQTLSPTQSYTDLQPLQQRIGMAPSSSQETAPTLSPLLGWLE